MSNYPNTISASRVGAMLGVDPRKTPLALYHELRGELPEQEDNEVLKEGRYFEDAIARIAAEKFKLEVDAPPRHEIVHGVLSGHIDRVFTDPVTKTAGVLEIKNTLFGGSDGDWGDEGSDKVPMHYWFQAQVYGHLYLLWSKGRNGEGWTTAEYTYLAARLYGGTRLFKIAIDPQVIAKVEEEAQRFLDRVHSGSPPDPQDEHDSRRRWLAAEDLPVVGGPQQIEWLRALKQQREIKRAAEKAESDLVTLILGYMQEGNKLVVNHPVTGVPMQIATAGSDRHFNAEKFMVEQPETAARYLKLDATKLRADHPKLHGSYMERPTSALDQKRVIRISKDLDSLS